MKKPFIKIGLPLAPVIILVFTLYFLSYAVQLFKDTAYRFVYGTNVDSILQFSTELNELTEQGYSSNVYGDFFSRLIENYAVTLGGKYAIVTFYTDDSGEIFYSGEADQAYLADILNDAGNKQKINEAAEGKSFGELMIDHGGKQEAMYHHWFYSGPLNYNVYMTVDKQAIESRLNVNGVVIPIAAIGLLLFLLMEYLIWLQKIHMAAHEAKAGDNDAN